MLKKLHVKFCALLKVMVSTVPVSIVAEKFLNFDTSGNPVQSGTNLLWGISRGLRIPSLEKFYPSLPTVEG